MTDLTFLADIPEAQDLEQNEFSTHETQRVISFVVQRICQDIENNRDKLISGATIETISIGATRFGEPSVRDKYNRWLYQDDQPVFVSNLILKAVVRCFQLKGYKLQFSSALFSWREVFLNEFWDTSVRRRRMYVSVKKKNAIVRVDDLTLMQSVEHIFDKELGAVGSRR